jgi:hypothetical protein
MPPCGILSQQAVRCLPESLLILDNANVCVSPNLEKSMFGVLGTQSALYYSGTDLRRYTESVAFCEEQNGRLLRYGQLFVATDVSSLLLLCLEV